MICFLIVSVVFNIIKKLKDVIFYNVIINYYEIFIVNFNLMIYIVKCFKNIYKWRLYVL